MLTPSKLLQAFKSLDQDSSGAISIDEFKRTVDRDASIPDQAWEIIFAEVDDDGSGEVNLEEFSILMRKVFEVEENYD